MFCIILMHRFYSNLQTCPACPWLWNQDVFWSNGNKHAWLHRIKSIPEHTRTTHPTTDVPYTQSTSSCRSNSHICCSAFRNVPQYGLIATTNLCKSHRVWKGSHYNYHDTLCWATFTVRQAWFQTKGKPSQGNTSAVHISLCEFDTQVSCMGLICRNTCIQNARECLRAKERISLLSTHQQNLEATHHHEVIKQRIQTNPI